ncbi:trypsin-like peptidase [Sediminihabitans luteus]|uniref:Trypsin-like peptidase n=1 Tax=Sediminihabitans luteus TaxID=1138585 RepID=A0A2M9CCT1_9CELL|nr:serine protease [Sediminihabitans luteus]PJJ69111.1 trypsin-like peptidase [Sediminihabitans luteus]GII99497.1 hypothetical protein Slu03_18750 [Sediminihabitans luteus]
MSGPRPGRAAAAVVAVLAGVLLAGCGAIPDLPDDVPPADSLVPSVAPRDDLSAVQDLTPDGSDAVRRMALRVRNVQCSGLATGSGFAIDAHTLITNRHVVEGAKSLQLLTYDGRDVTVEQATSAGLADLAILRTTEELPAHPELASADPREGDEVTVVGYPEGGALTVTQGTVIGTTQDPLHSTLGEVLITNAKVEPGSSGSAALDASGRVIGVVYAKTGDGRSLLVPVSTLRSMLDDTGAFAPVAPCS